MVLTLLQKQNLQTQVQSGKRVATVAYNPAGGTGPETAATSAGWVQFARTDTATLVEVIYTK
jgi:hypothetical protein